MTRLRLLPTILATIFFFILNLLISSYYGTIEDETIPFTIGCTIIFYLILNRWFSSNQDATAGPNSRSNDTEDTQPARTRGFSKVEKTIMTWWKSIFKKKNAMSNDLQLQGVVRGFKESRQHGGFDFMNRNLDVIVWTFQLERHSDTEERLDPVPVEMRGKNFSGFINEGNVIRLYEKSWHGGFVRTKRVYNVTFKEDIEARG